MRSKMYSRTIKEVQMPSFWDSKVYFILQIVGLLCSGWKLGNPCVDINVYFMIVVTDSSSY